MLPKTEQYIAISNFVYSAEPAFDAVLVDRSLSFEREAGFAIQLLTASNYIAGMAVTDGQSVVNAVTNIAAIGISLNPAKKQAYLVPRKGVICLDISYIGLIDLAVSSGAILWAQANIVHENDDFALNGFDKPPTHSYNPFSRDRGAMVGAYVVVKASSGDYLTDCMSYDEIDYIRSRSESVKAGKSSPWITDYGEMAKKTVVKRAYKYWPKTDRLDSAIHHLNTDGGEGVELISNAAPQRAGGLDWDAACAQIEGCTDAAELKVAWENWGAQAIKAKSKEGHASLKELVKVRLQAIRDMDAARTVGVVTDTEPKEEAVHG